MKIILIILNNITSSTQSLTNKTIIGNTNYVDANGLKTTGQVAYIDPYGITPLTGYTFFTNGGPIYKINSSTGVLEASSAFCPR